jgi:hypothetical protein
MLKSGRAIQLPLIEKQTIRIWVNIPPPIGELSTGRWKKIDFPSDGKAYFYVANAEVAVMASHIDGETEDISNQICIDNPTGRESVTRDKWVDLKPLLQLYS